MRRFHRTSCSIRLTEAGHALLDRTRPPLDELSGALDGARAAVATPSGSLRLNVPRIANDLIIAPLVARSLFRYPAITLEIESFDGLVDIVADGFDAGIRRDCGCRQEWSRFRSVRHAGSPWSDHPALSTAAPSRLFPPICMSISASAGASRGVHATHGSLSKMATVWNRTLPTGWWWTTPRSWFERRWVALAWRSFSRSWSETTSRPEP